MSSGSGYTNWSHLPAASKSGTPLSMRRMNPPVIAGRLAADSGSLLTFTRSGSRSIFSISVKNPRKSSGAHVTAVVDHEHFGEARARRVTPDAVAEREGERVPDQRPIVGDGVGQHPIGVAGQPEHRPIAVGILVVGAQLDGVLLLRKVCATSRRARECRCGHRARRGRRCGWCPTSAPTPGAPPGRVRSHRQSSVPDSNV